jgi:hypothetical protein
MFEKSRRNVLAIGREIFAEAEAEKSGEMQQSALQDIQRNRGKISGINRRRAENVRKNWGEKPGRMQQSALQDIQRNRRKIGGVNRRRVENVRNNWGEMQQSALQDIQ